MTPRTLIHNAAMAHYRTLPPDSREARRLASALGLDRKPRRPRTDAYPEIRLHGDPWAGSGRPPGPDAYEGILIETGEILPET